MTALHALLAGIVDYAGLFPPAALDMRAAVQSYATYRGHRDSWMLGRFVVPVARLDEFVAARLAVDGGADDEWRLAALLGTEVEADLDRIHAFNAIRRVRATIDVAEAKLASADAIARAGHAAGTDVALFAEIPVHDDPAPLVAAIKRADARAKIRTGGVTTDAFPSAAEVIRFLRRCAAAAVAFKATAGLHHPLGADYPLTYGSDAPRGEMFGFLNVFLAAAFLSAGLSDEDAGCILEERSATAFTITGDAIGWRDHFLSSDQLRVIRETVAISFGSCSFHEPVDDLRALSILT